MPWKTNIFARRGWRWRPTRCRRCRAVRWRVRKEKCCQYYPGVKQQRLFGLHHQVRDLCLADVDDFVPRDAVAEEGRSCFQRHLTRTARISDAHGATRQGAAEMCRVKVALMTDTRREGAAKKRIVLTHEAFRIRLALPTRLHRIGQTFSLSGSTVSNGMNKNAARCIDRPCTCRCM